MLFLDWIEIGFLRYLATQRCCLYVGISGAKPALDRGAITDHGHMRRYYDIAT
jgi:hypothetical protein